jgi:hypothetical protein
MARRTARRTGPRELGSCAVVGRTVRRCIATLCGPDADELSYAGRAAAVAVDLAEPGPDRAPGEGDPVTGIESVTGGRGDDRLPGDGGANRLTRGAGLAARALGSLAVWNALPTTTRPSATTSPTTTPAAAR